MTRVQIRVRPYRYNIFVAWLKWECGRYICVHADIQAAHWEGSPLSHKIFEVYSQSIYTYLNLKRR